MVTTDNIKNMTYTDQTGKIPVVSSQGNKYIMVMYEKDGILILVKRMKTRASEEMCCAYNKLMERLHERGIKFTKHILDNEASREYLQAIKCNGVTYEKVPPNIHCRNKAEKAIRTFKDQFQAIIARVDHTFPMHLWDSLLPWVENTLNMLQPTNITPRISVYA